MLTFVFVGEKVLTCWGYFIIILGPSQLFKHVINKVLPVIRVRVYLPVVCITTLPQTSAQSAFVAKDEVAIAAFRAWRYLVWSVSCDPDKLKQKRLQFLMKPIVNAYVSRHY